MSFRIFPILSLILAILAYGAGWAESALADTEGSSLEYAVKATYLYKFGDFVEWPAGAFPPSGSPVTLCVAGQDPFGSNLESTVAGQRIADRLIVVRHLQRVARDSGCQILFVGGTDPQQIGEMLKTVRGNAVLTVTDNRSDNSVPSIIRFVVMDNHVRFVIDLRAAAANGMTVRSQLLNLSLPPSAGE